MGIYRCPKADGRTADGMILCRDGKLCAKQQYCQSRRVYENTPGVGSCERRKTLNGAEHAVEK